MVKVRKVKIGIKDVETLLSEFADAAGAIEAGKAVKHERAYTLRISKPFARNLQKKGWSFSTQSKLNIRLR